MKEASDSDLVLFQFYFLNGQIMCAENDEPICIWNVVILCDGKRMVGESSGIAGDNISHT